jgi:hypothetical protein
VKDQIGDQRGVTEWELIKILSQKNSAYIPIATPRVTHEQVEAHTNLSRDLRNKAWKSRKQSGSKHKRARATKRKAETYRVNRHKWPGHPKPSRATPGHPGTSVRVNLPPSGHPTQVTRSPGTAQKTACESASNFRSMDLPKHLESWDEIFGRW